MCSKQDMDYEGRNRVFNITDFIYLLSFIYLVTISHTKSTFPHTGILQIADETGEGNLVQVDSVCIYCAR